MTTDWSNPRHRRIKFRAFMKFMKNFYPYIILIAALLLISLYTAHKGNVVKPVSYISIAHAAVATPSATLAPAAEDKRIELLRDFFIENNSPLASYMPKPERDWCRNKGCLKTVSMKVAKFSKEQ